MTMRASTLLLIVTLAIGVVAIGQLVKISNAYIYKLQTELSKIR